MDKEEFLSEQLHIQGIKFERASFAKEGLICYLSVILLFSSLFLMVCVSFEKSSFTKYLVPFKKWLYKAYVPLICK